MIQKTLDITQVIKHWYVINGNEHTKLNSYWEALDYAKPLKGCKVMSENYYKQCYEK